MKKVLIKVKDKSVLLQLKQFGEYEVISSVFGIYAMELSDTKISQLEAMEGILSIEEEEYFEAQETCFI